jgi:hypothetical protein
MAFLSAFLAMIAAVSIWLAVNIFAAHSGIPELSTVSVWLSYWTVTGWFFLLALFVPLLFTFRRLLGHARRASQ